MTTNNYIRPTNYEIKLFKKSYCCNEHNRQQMLLDFKVSVESFEELLFGQYINSYATGERKIENTFMMFNVYDEANHKRYYPVFSESIAREILKNSSIKIPRKITIFSNARMSNDNSTMQKSVQSDIKDNRTARNRALMDLIELARAFMLLGVVNPQPMDGVFKKIYDELILYPKRDPFESKIKSINTALGNYINNHGKKKGFYHLNDFIEYVKNMQGNKKIKKFDFEILRTSMKERYSQEPLFF